LKGKASVAKVDCTVESEIGDRFSITGYPTLKLLTNGKLYEYNGDRSEEDLVKFTSEYGSAASIAVPKKPTNSAPVETAEVGSSSDVIVLTDATFDQQIASGSWLLEFYAPWCGHCKKLAPIYEKVATNLKGSTNVAKIDCTTETASCRRFGIRGYPTVKFVKDGKVIDYKSERTPEAFAAFVSEGYLKADTTPLPEKRSVLEEVADGILSVFRDLEKFVREKMWIAFAIIFIVGLILGKCIFATPLPTSPPKPHTQ